MILTITIIITIPITITKSEAAKRAPGLTAQAAAASCDGQMATASRARRTPTIQRIKLHDRMFAETNGERTATASRGRRTPM